MFPLLEIFDGEKYKINQDIPTKPVSEYLKPQGRFSKLSTEETAAIKEEVDAYYNYLVSREESGGILPGVTG